MFGDQVAKACKNIKNLINHLELLIMHHLAAKAMTASPLDPWTSEVSKTITKSRLFEVPCYFHLAGQQFLASKDCSAAGWSCSVGLEEAPMAGFARFLQPRSPDLQDLLGKALTLLVELKRGTV